ncbi:MAG TPA: hypothetical protein VK173_06990, partial [Lacibacter sp.]|nr:hypothetical protein [Lacibacter sp.]
MVILFIWLFGSGFVQAQKVDLETKSILNDKVEILIPKTFTLMDDATKKIKYPSQRAPSIVYTNEEANVNVAFSETSSRASQEALPEYLTVFISSFKTAHPNAQWEGNGIVEINSRKVGYLELITEAVDTKIYNLLFFTDVNGKLLICTVNVTQQ